MTPGPWELPSNSGWNHIAALCRKAYNQSGEDLFLADITIKGEMWDRSNDDVMSSDLLEDFHVRLPQVVLSKDKIRSACQILTDWLDCPQPVTIDLAVDPQLLSMTFSDRDDLICSMDKPACAFTYSASRTEITSVFVVDQSCIRILRDGLREWASIRW